MAFYCFSLVFLTLLSFFPSTAVSQPRNPTDWVLANQSDNCNVACAAVGGTCNADGMEHVTSVQRLEYVLQFVDVVCTSLEEDDFIPRAVPAILVSTGQCFYDDNRDVHADCVSGPASDQRICCCGEVCPTFEGDPQTHSPTMYPTSAQPTKEPTPHPTETYDPTVHTTYPPTTTAAPTAAATEATTRVLPGSSGWIQAAMNENCNSVCEEVGGFCNAPAMEGVNTIERLQFVVNTLGIECTAIEEDDFIPRAVPSQLTSTGVCFFDNSSEVVTDCVSAPNSDRRICCCNDFCPTSA